MKVLRSDPDRCPLSAFLPFVHDVLLHHVFKSSNTDVDSFTLQLHSNRVRLSLQPRDHYAIRIVTAQGSGQTSVSDKLGMD